MPDAVTSITMGRHKHNKNKGLSVPTKMETSQTPANAPFHAHGAETTEEGV